MKILSVNCQSWNTAKNSITCTVDDNDIDILCLSETWESSSKPVKFRNWSVLSRPRPDDSGYGGVSLAYKPTDNVYLNRRSDLERPDTEVICVDVTLKSKLSFLLVVAYIPPARSIDQLEGLIDIIQTSNHKNIIVTGDLNAKSQEWGNAHYNSYGRRWESFLHQEGLLCINDCLPTKRKDDSVIDLFVVNPQLIPRVELCATLAHEQIRSDHVAVLLEIDKVEPQDRKVEKYLIGNTDWEEWNKVSESLFATWNTENAAREWVSVEDIYTSFNLVFNKCRDKSVPKKLVSCSRRRLAPPWMTDAVKEARHGYNVAKKGFKRRATDQQLHKLLESKRRRDEAEEEAKKQWVDGVCDKMTSTKDSKELWDCFRSLTSYQNLDGCDVLPLLDEQNVPRFLVEEKCSLLQDTFFSGKHLAHKDFDRQFQLDIERNLESIVDGSDSDTTSLDTGFINETITRDETVAALMSLTKGKASGPDRVFTDLLLNAGNQLVTAIHSLFKYSFEKGEAPQDWKLAEVKFLKKAGKRSYHTSSSYRPISLTSSLGKCLEKIITTRLYAFVEHHKIIDREQEGFRKNHSTTQALLRLVQTVMDGFNQDSVTLAAFVDLEKAYDSVWRDGLLVKLHRQGIQGKTWWWIRDFLDGRKAVCSLQGIRGGTFDTTVGLPQGSVISPLLFNLYIKDIFSKATGGKIKFADDGSLLQTGKVLEELRCKMETDLETVADWAKKWRMNVSVEKTEICLFRKKARHPITDNPKVAMCGKAVPYNPHPRVLGVHLDEELNFSFHLDKVEQRANKALSLIRAVKETEKVGTKRLIQLYKAIVVSHLEYAAPVWQASGFCNKLESIQRKALVMCMGGLTTSGRESLEVELNVLPLQLRREELSLRELGKTLAKDNTEPLKRKVLAWQERMEPEKHLSPIGLMLIQAEDMTKETKVTLHTVEPEFSYLTGLQQCRSSPEYWTALGSSKSRTKVQESQSRQMVTSMLGECSPRTMVAFTDGSCQPNPGPCGAGCCILLPGEETPVKISKPVSHHSSILLGELVAILTTLEYALGELNPESVDRVQIFSDSQSSIGLLKLGWKPRQYHSTIETAKSMIAQLQAMGIRVDIDWSPGHASIEGNEIADALAKEASREAALMDSTNNITSQGDIKGAARVSVVAKWQRQWDVAEAGRRLYRFKPCVTDQSNLDSPSRQLYSKIAQLRTGYVKLGKYSHQLGLVDNPYCAECDREETVSHFLLECTRFEEPRERLRTKLFSVCGESTLTEEVLLGVGLENTYQEFRENINVLLGEFIAQSKHV
jgi:ribonuclease HI